MSVILLNLHGETAVTQVPKRRDLLLTAAVFAAMSAISPLRLALAQSRLRRTPDQILGPFYPAMKAADLSGDLTHVPERPGRAEGQLLNVMGRVLDIRGEPVPEATLEVWQANTYGRYTHPADRNPAPLDPNFEGFASLKTDTRGPLQIQDREAGRLSPWADCPRCVEAPPYSFSANGSRG